MAQIKRCTIEKMSFFLSNAYLNSYSEYTSLQVSQVCQKCLNWHVVCIRTPSRGPPPWYDCGGRTRTGSRSATLTGKDYASVIIYHILLYFSVGVSYVDMQRLHHCLCFMMENINVKVFLHYCSGDCCGPQASSHYKSNYKPIVM